MRSKALAALLAIVLLMPIAAAHGANTYSFIMRSQAIQPESAQVTQNDTLIFHNTAEHNRSLLVDLDADEIDDVICNAGPSTESDSTEDECWIWLDPSNWTEGEYVVRVMENGSLWQTVELLIALDNHTETLPSNGYVLEPRPQGGNNGTESVLLSAAILLAGASAFVWVIRNVKGDEEE
ncbi:uncharacterized protein METZ01_LOCUS76669 [marine metagenome]|uniref:Uncharacterized protein n=1 Tax=marine metagenome TaxID=408172 RepID=A0A381U6D3_9ZZZZ